MMCGDDVPGNPAEVPLWRAMRADDLDAVVVLAGRIHAGLPERPAVFAERLALFPAGCLVLAAGSAVEGYAVAHPVRRGAPPPLDTLLGRLPADADGFYLHDVAVAPARRGAGLAAAGVRRLLPLGVGFATTGLVSVYGTASFWAGFGFVPVPLADEKLRPYGVGAVYMERDNRA